MWKYRSASLDHLDAYNLNCHNDHKKYRKTITSILKSSGLYNYVYNPPTILNDIETQTRKTFLVSDMLITSKKNIILSSTCEDKNNIQMVVATSCLIAFLGANVL